MCWKMLFSKCCSSTASKIILIIYILRLLYKLSQSSTALSGLHDHFHVLYKHFHVLFGNCWVFSRTLMPLLLLSGPLPAFLQPLQAYSGPQIAQRSLSNAHLISTWCCTCICKGSNFSKPNLSKYLHVLICSRTADCVPQIFYHRMSAALNANNTQPLKEKMSYAVQPWNLFPSTLLIHPLYLTVHRSI